MILEQHLLGQYFLQILHHFADFKCEFPKI